MRTSVEGMRSSTSPQMEAAMRGSLQTPPLTCETTTLEVLPLPRTPPGEDSTTLTELPSKTAENPFEERSAEVMTCEAVSPVIVSCAPEASWESDHVLSTRAFRRAS